MLLTALRCPVRVAYVNTLPGTDDQPFHPCGTGTGDDVGVEVVFEHVSSRFTVRGQRDGVDLVRVNNRVHYPGGMERALGQPF